MNITSLSPRDQLNLALDDFNSLVNDDSANYYDETCDNAQLVMDALLDCTDPEHSYALALCMLTNSLMMLQAFGDDRKQMNSIIEQRMNLIFNLPTQD